uniref:Peptidase A1 domain-containing protein n=1 Tax=Kalanchoe fedtschenkoi TaxID=63787 RepID=A0A7N0T0G6_KALFE
MSISRICIALSLFVSFSLLISFSAAQTRGFSTKIYTWDSPGSPFYDPALTQTERFLRSIARSNARANRFRLDASTGSPKAPVFVDGGSYLMNISLGTPAVPIVAIADTGSDLIWTQCAPCTKCFTQKLPLYDPKKSSTFRVIPCNSTACPSDTQTVCTKDKKCGYAVRFGDGSYSNGLISTETITLESTGPRPVTLPKSIFGCGFDNNGTFSPNGTGIIGLGGGSESLVSQLGDQINGKFSYCLVPITLGDGTSTINFGKSAAVSGRGVVKTPLVKKKPDTYYYATLKGFTIGGQKVPFTTGNSTKNSTAVKEGNIILDSGTTLVYLPPDYVTKLESVIKKHTIPAPTPTLDSLKPFRLCYIAGSSFTPPKIIANWAGGDVELKSYHAFVEPMGGIICLAFVQSNDYSIYGNVAQRNFLIGYDTVGGTVSFKPADCTKA